MKDRHILEILDEAGFAAIQGDALETVQAHCAVCAECRKAFAAARISWMYVAQATGAVMSCDANHVALSRASGSLPCATAACSSAATEKWAAMC